jgi:transcriptional regulator with XRE-family HTH domain
MNTAMTYGGWVTDRPAATGVSSTVVRLAGWMAAAGVVLSSIGTGGELSIEHLQRSPHQMQLMAPTVDVAPVRSPAEDLVRIREVLKPAVSDLATTFGVSRQSVYNWLNGEPVAEENAAKLQDLAEAADLLAHEGIAVNAALLKRKFTNGRTLLQVAQAGESARDAALQLVHIYKRETTQRERMAARFANRGKTAPSADFDLPSASDDA